MNKHLKDEGLILWGTLDLLLHIHNLLCYRMEASIGTTVHV